MSFSVPTFNLTCAIHTFGIPIARLFSPCNLAMGRRQLTVGASGTGVVGVPGFVMTLLLPALTDIRSALSVTGPDRVQVPLGSGRFYDVFVVDDMGKGFANEHRVALLVQVTQPTPLT